MVLSFQPTHFPVFVICMDLKAFQLLVKSLFILVFLNLNLFSCTKSVILPPHSFIPHEFISNHRYFFFLDKTDNTLCYYAFHVVLTDSVDKHYICILSHTDIFSQVKLFL